MTISRDSLIRAVVMMRFELVKLPCSIFGLDLIQDPRHITPVMLKPRAAGATLYSMTSIIKD